MAGSNLLVRIEIKIMLSTPKTISKNVRVIKAKRSSIIRGAKVGGI
jgi:hypothetical protein